jgi:tellurite resistance protein
MAAPDTPIADPSMPLPKLSPEDALIWTMVMVSAADRKITDDEVDDIQERIIRLPAFADFDVSRLPSVADDCATALSDDNALPAVLARIREALPRHLRETAYVLALDILVADGEESEEELRLAEELREALDLDELVASAFERALRARYARL